MYVERISGNEGANAREVRGEGERRRGERRGGKTGNILSASSGS